MADVQNAELISRRDHATATALQSFNNLPDTAYVRIRVVAALFAISEYTVRRWVTAGRLPAPKTIGPQTIVWRVGEIRRALEAA